MLCSTFSVETIPAEFLRSGIIPFLFEINRTGSFHNRLGHTKVCFEKLIRTITIQQRTIIFQVHADVVQCISQFTTGSKIDSLRFVVPEQKDKFIPL